MTTNRLGVPNGMAGTISYDTAGNLTFDNYTGSGERRFDAENRLTGAYVGPAVNETAQGRYTYDGDGRRIIRTANSVTTWQVYGFAGELIAEYAAYGASFVPQKEYGYQSGKMLITARNGHESRLHKFIQNLSLRTGRSFTPNEIQVRVNALANAGSSSENALLAEATNQARLLLSQYQENNPTAQAFVQALYLSVLQRYGTPAEVSWWASQAQGNPDGVREAFLSSGEFADRVHNLYGSDQSDTQRTDAFAEHLYQSILGRALDASAQAWLRNSLDQASAKDLPTTISNAQEWAQSLFNCQEYQNRGRNQHWFVYDLYLTYLGYEPDAAGWAYWESQVGTNWQNKQAVMDAFAQAGPYGEKAGTLYREIFWLVGDHLGTPRLIAERTGSAAGIKRHDYLPFGEEIGQGVGGRADGHGYQTVATHDGARQQFTGYERDDETGLDYAQARYYASGQGRFTTPDKNDFAKREQPQTWNLYIYTSNNPLTRIDPKGRDWFEVNGHLEYHKGKTYDYNKTVNGKTEKIKAKNVGIYAVKFEVTNIKDGTAEGKLTLYKQDKAVAKNAAAFSGGSGDKPTIGRGLYWIRTDLRDDADKSDEVQKEGGTYLKPFYGLQQIPKSSGFQDSWGSRRIALNSDRLDCPTCQGNYIHGQGADHAPTTAGCICDKPNTVINAIFNIDPKVQHNIKVEVNYDYVERFDGPED